MFIFFFEQIFNQLKFQSTDRKLAKSKITNDSFIGHGRNDLEKPCWRDSISKNDRYAFHLSINKSAQYLNSAHTMQSPIKEKALILLLLFRNFCRSDSGFSQCQNFFDPSNSFCLGNAFSLIIADRKKPKSKSKEKTKKWFGKSQCSQTLLLYLTLRELFKLFSRLISA